MFLAALSERERESERERVQIPSKGMIEGARSHDFETFSVRRTLHSDPFNTPRCDHKTHNDAAADAQNLRHMASSHFSLHLERRLMIVM